MRTPTWYNLIFRFALAGAGAFILQMGVSLCNAKGQVPIIFFIFTAAIRITHYV